MEQQADGWEIMGDSKGESKDGWWHPGVQRWRYQGAEVGS